MSTESTATIIVSIVTALGLRELIVLLIKRRYKKQDEQKTNEEKERALNRELMNSMLSDVKRELSILKDEMKDRGRIEIEYREKFSHCKAQLELLFKEVHSYVSDKR